MEKKGIKTRIIASALAAIFVVSANTMTFKAAAAVTEQNVVVNSVSAINGNKRILSDISPIAKSILNELIKTSLGKIPVVNLAKDTISGIVCKLLGTTEEKGNKAIDEIKLELSDVKDICNKTQKISASSNYYSKNLAVVSEELQNLSSANNKGMQIVDICSTENMISENGYLAQVRSEFMNNINGKWTSKDTFVCAGYSIPMSNYIQKGKEVYISDSVESEKMINTLANVIRAKDLCAIAGNAKGIDMDSYIEYVKKYGNALTGGNKTLSALNMYKGENVGEYEDYNEYIQAKQNAYNALKQYSSVFKVYDFYKNDSVFGAEAAIKANPIIEDYLNTFYSASTIAMTSLIARGNNPQDYTIIEVQKDYNALSEIIKQMNQVEDFLRLIEAEEQFTYIKNTKTVDDATNITYYFEENSVNGKFNVIHHTLDAEQMENDGILSKDLAIEMSTTQNFNTMWGGDKYSWSELDDSFKGNDCLYDALYGNMNVGYKVKILNKNSIKEIDKTELINEYYRWYIMNKMPTPAYDKTQELYYLLSNHIKNDLPNTTIIDYLVNTVGFEGDLKSDTAVIPFENLEMHRTGVNMFNGYGGGYYNMTVGATDGDNSVYKICPYYFKTTCNPCKDRGVDYTQGYDYIFFQ